MPASAPRTDPFPQPGEWFAERYRIVGQIGRGGFSRVYSARQEQLDRPVAIKILAPKTGHAATSREVTEKRFYREARLLSRLTGRHIVEVYDYGRTPSGLLFMVLELVDGRTLKEVLEQEGALAEGRARRILTQILRGLLEAHERGILHRDIKPSNIMVFDQLDERDCVKLLDFGLAKGVTTGARDATSLTLAGSVLGTPGYMSPEQALGEPVDRSSDLFSTGLVAYEMLVGRSPFEGLTFQQVQVLLATDEVRLPTTVRIADDFARVLRRCFATQSETRYRSAAEALEDLGVTSGAYEVDAHAMTLRQEVAPRPSNVVTFPMIFDTSGSTGVDMLTDPQTGETTVVELRLPTKPVLKPDSGPREPRHGETSLDAQSPPDGPARSVLPRPPPARTADEGPRPLQRTSPPSGTTSGDVQETGNRAWLGYASLTAILIVGATLTVRWARDDHSAPQKGTSNPRLAIEAGGSIVHRSLRGAELDANIRAKEERLRTWPVAAPAGPEETDDRPTGSARPSDREDRGKSVRTRSTRPASKANQPAPGGDSRSDPDAVDPAEHRPRQGHDTERDGERDFTVEPIDEL